MAQLERSARPRTIGMADKIVAARIPMNLMTSIASEAFVMAKPADW